MSGRNPVDAQQKVKNFFGQTANFNANQQTYLTGNLAHQMNYTELGRFARLDDPKGIDSLLNRFENPLAKIEKGTEGNPDVKHIQNVCLDPIIQQDVRRIHLMCHFYMRAGHE